MDEKIEGAGKITDIQTKAIEQTLSSEIDVSAIQKSNESTIRIEPEKPQNLPIDFPTISFDSASSTQHSTINLVQLEEKVENKPDRIKTDKVPIQEEKSADTNQDLSKEAIIANTESAPSTNISPTKSKKKKEKVVIDPLSPSFHNFLASSTKKQDLQIDIEHPASIASPPASNQNSGKSNSTEVKNLFAMDTMVSYSFLKSNIHLCNATFK